MRFPTLVVVSIMGLSIGLWAGASTEAAPEALPGSGATGVAGEADSGAAPAAVEEPASGDTGIALGPVGYDAEGRPGRVHLVRGGDTLWDISEAYLGTPWVWPSVWQDNGEIENPHLIHPGDRIWITANQMRPVSHQEAQELVNGSPGEGLPASLDETPGITDEMAAPPRVYPVSTIDSTGLVTHSQVEGAASIIDSPAERVWLGDADPVFIGLGANQVEAGDQFTIFRTAQRVLHPESGEVYGYHVEVLGWLEVTKVEEESTVAEIRLSYAEIRRGDRILPREKMRKEIEVRSGAPLVNGQILHLPDRRTNIGSADVVFLDRGRFDGLDVGVPLEVFRPGREAPEVTRDETLQTPDWVVAKLLVVSAQEESATALVTHATTELERGDRFRTSRDGSLN